MRGAVLIVFLGMIVTAVLLFRAPWNEYHLYDPTLVTRYYHAPAWEKTTPHTSLDDATLVLEVVGVWAVALMGIVLLRVTEPHWIDVHQNDH